MVGVPGSALLRVITVGAIIGGLTGRRIGLLVVKPGLRHFQPMADLCISGTSGSTSTAHLAWKRCPGRWPTSARGAPLGKVVVEVRPSPRFPEALIWADIRSLKVR